MIFFPSLFKDEILFSAMARYHCYSGNGNSKISMIDMFSLDTTCAVISIPAKLHSLCEELPQKNAYTPEQLIQNHTLLPYYAPFMPFDRYQQIKAIMANENGQSLFMKLGRVSSTVKSPKYLKYCLECNTEEMKLSGEVYWHRTHQIEGVEICPKHSTLLVESIIPFSERKHKHELLPLEISIGICDTQIAYPFEEKVYIHLKYIAKQSYLLLNTNIEPIGLEKLQKYYLSKLQDIGLASMGGRVRWKKFIPRFNAFYGKDFLNRVNSYVECEKTDTWLHKLLRKPKVCCHPLRHILLLGFLKETISSLVSNINSNAYHPFGTGPWLCLNKAAKHYKKAILTSCKITADYKTGLPVGTFSCSCGFVYSRKGPDLKDKDSNKIGRIKHFGPVWEEKLALLVKRGLSLRKMADELGVDPMTVKRRLSLKGAKTEKTAPSLEKRKEEYRNEWLMLINSNLDKTISEIRSLNAKLYTWLYRNDKDWLKGSYTVCKRARLKMNSTRIDWEKRDQDTAQKVKIIDQDILTEKEKLIKVTKNEIGRRLGKLTLLVKNLEKLPKTKEILNISLESVEEFQIRRVKHVIQQQRMTNSSIKEWQVVRLAGLKKKDASKLSEVIQNEINSYSKHFL